MLLHSLIRGGAAAPDVIKESSARQPVKILQREATEAFGATHVAPRIRRRVCSELEAEREALGLVKEDAAPESEAEAVAAAVETAAAGKLGERDAALARTSRALELQCTLGSAALSAARELEGRRTAAAMSAVRTLERQRGAAAAAIDAARGLEEERTAAAVRAARELEAEAAALRGRVAELECERAEVRDLAQQAECALEFREVEHARTLREKEAALARSEAARAKALAEMGAVEEREQAGRADVLAEQELARSSKAEAEKLRERVAALEREPSLDHAAVRRPAVRIQETVECGGGGPETARHIYVECPGARESEIDVQSLPSGVRLRIAGSDSREEGGSGLSRSAFEHTFPHDNQEPFELCKGECKLEYGILHLVLRRGTSICCAPEVRGPPRFL